MPVITTSFNVAGGGGCNCCGASPSCYFTIPPPIGASPYADLATATAVLGDPLQVASCVGFYPGGPPLASFTATLGTGTLNLAVTDPGPFGFLGVSVWCGATCLSGETVTFTVSGFALVSAEIYDATGTLVESISAGAVTITSAALPADGCYEFKINMSAFMTPVSSGDVTISSSGTIIFSTIQAAYDDGMGGTAYVICT